MHPELPLSTPTVDKARDAAISTATILTLKCSEIGKAMQPVARRERHPHNLTHAQTPARLAAPKK